MKLSQRFKPSGRTRTTRGRWPPGVPGRAGGSGSEVPGAGGHPRHGLPTRGPSGAECSCSLGLGSLCWDGGRDSWSPAPSVGLSYHASQTTACTPDVETEPGKRLSCLAPNLRADFFPPRQPQPKLRAHGLSHTSNSSQESWLLSPWTRPPTSRFRFPATLGLVAVSPPSYILVPSHYSTL